MSWWDRIGLRVKRQNRYEKSVSRTGFWETLHRYLTTDPFASIRTRTPSTAASSSNQSQAARQYTPAGSSSAAASSSTNYSSMSKNTQSGSPNSSIGGPTEIKSQFSSNASHYIPTSPVRILFGVQGRRWSLELEQIILSGLSNDPTLFRELKARYRRHRGLIKLLLSPYRFRFCRFVKVSPRTYLWLPRPNLLHSLRNLTPVA
jgi:hypothetical protein